MRQRRGSDTWCLMPVTVLDVKDRIVLRLAAGAYWLAAVDDHGRRVKTYEDYWRLDAIPWFENDATYFVTPDRSACLIALVLSREPVGVAKWYVNCQEPLQVTPYGFDTLDLELDLEKRPGDSGYSWKDWDDFSELSDRGLIDGGRRREIYEDARRQVYEAPSIEGARRTAELLRSSPPIPELCSLLSCRFEPFALAMDRTWRAWKSGLR